MKHLGRPRTTIAVDVAKIFLIHVIWLGIQCVQQSRWGATAFVLSPPLRTRYTVVGTSTSKDSYDTALFITGTSRIANVNTNNGDDMDDETTTTTRATLECQLKDVGLTPDQIQTVLLQLQSNNNKNKCPNTAVIDVLAWLQLSFTREQMAALVVGLPSLLQYDIRTNLEPTIQFYQDALGATVGECGSEDPTKIDSNQHSSTSEWESSIAPVSPRLATFLCESPRLLEYNVQKRLIPRLQRVRQTAAALKDNDKEKSLRVNVDETILQAIATLTDSRFETWLQQEYEWEECPSTSKASSSKDQYRSARNDSTQDTQSIHSDNDNMRTPSSYVIVSNLQSGSNIGNILRSASIFGCHECIVVGQKRHRLTGDHGSRFDLPRRHFYSHEQAREYLNGINIRIYGVEIMEDASPLMRYNATTGVVEFPFEATNAKGAAFVLGNEGQGLSTKQKEMCDAFLYIPQTRGGTRAGGGGGSASLNVACAATVVLQAYSLWASYPDAQRKGEKFVAD